jgi:hypothetical protein
LAVRTIHRIIKGSNFVSTPAPSRQAAHGKERNIRTQTSKRPLKVFRRKIPVEPSPQTQQSNGSVGAAATQSRTNRNVLEEFDSKPDLFTRQYLKCPNGSHDQITFPSFDVMGNEFKPVCACEENVVGPVDRLQRGSNLVEAIRTPTQNSKIEIDFCEGVQKHGTQKTRHRIDLLLSTPVNI